MNTNKKPHYDLGKKPLAHDKKMTFDFFLRSVWAMSQTNLHYHDFKLIHGDILKTIFKPYRPIVDAPALAAVAPSFKVVNPVFVPDDCGHCGGSGMCPDCCPSGVERSDLNFIEIHCPACQDTCECPVCNRFPF